MTKHLLTFAAAAAVAFGAVAGETTVWTGTQKMENWSGNVSVPATDINFVQAGDQLIIGLTEVCELAPEQGYSTLAVKTNSEGWPNLEGTGYVNPSKGDTSYTFDLGAAAVDQLKATGLIVQGDNLTVTSVTVKGAADVNPNILFEGELTFSGWGVSGGDINPAKVKAGDVLIYTFSAAGDKDGQVLLKNSSWANLQGTAKMTTADFATGSVVVGVTQDMIDNCGSKFFLQGIGNAVLTKIEKSADQTFDPEGVIVYGARKPGYDAFIKIPEATEKVYITFTAAPTWFQLCNSSWTALQTNETSTLAATNEDGSVVYEVPVTAADITAINDKVEAIVNTDATVLAISTKKPAGQSALQVVNADTNAPVEYFNLQGVRVAEPRNGLYIRRQGNDVKKVVIK